MKTEPDVAKDQQDKLETTQDANQTPESSESRISSLESQLKESMATVILEQQKYKDLTCLHSTLKTDYDKLKTNQILNHSEISTLKVKVGFYT